MLTAFGIPGQPHTWSPAIGPIFMRQIISPCVPNQTRHALELYSLEWYILLTAMNPTYGTLRFTHWVKEYQESKQRG